MERCDVIVVGGGPAGSACARALTRAGMDVALLDKREFPRDKPCAGWITPGVIQHTDLNPAEYADGRVFQPIRGFCISRMHGPEFRITYPYPISYGICRRQFDHFLVRRSGARLHAGEPVQTLKRANDIWQVNGCYEAPVVVGAGGHFCPVARHLGARPDGPGRVVVAQETEVSLSARQGDMCRIDPEIPELYFCEDLRGYGWRVRKNDVLNIGLGREDSDGLAEHVEHFIALLRDRGRIPPDLPIRMRGHAYTLRGHNRRRCVGEGLILAGDAAGVAAAPSGEGILPAIISGTAAASTILAADGKYGDGRLDNHERELTRLLGPSGTGQAWDAYIPEAARKFTAALLLGMPWFIRRIVLERWFLHARPSPPQATDTMRP